MRRRAARLLALAATGASTRRLARTSASDTARPARLGRPRRLAVAGDEDRVVALGGLTWRALHVAG